MSKPNIQFEYDREVDAAYLTLARGRVVESEEVKPGVVVDYDAKGNVIGVEILRFARRFMTDAEPAVTRSRGLRKSA